VDQEIRTEILKVIPKLCQKEKEEDIESNSENYPNLISDYSESSERPEIEEGEEESSSSFLVPDDKIPKRYSVEEYYGKEEKKKQTKKRPNKKRQVFDPSDYQDDKAEDVEEIGSEDDIPDPVNIDGLEILKKQMKKSKDKPSVIIHSKWFQNQFGDIIDTITAQMGNDTKHEEHIKAVDNFCEVAEACLDGKSVSIELLVDKEGTCQFCTEKRTCHTGIMFDDKCFFVGSKCSELMQRFIDFFDCLSQLERKDHEEHFRELKKLLSEIPLGNSLKKNQGKDPDEGKTKRRKRKTKN
jgi:hypothetical protein